MTTTAYADLRKQIDRNKRFGWSTTQVVVADVDELLEEIAANCPDHTTCEHCGTELCKTHKVGEWATCGAITDTTVHCTDNECVGRCGDCGEAYRREHGLTRLGRTGL